MLTCPYPIGETKNAIGPLGLGYSHSVGYGLRQWTGAILGIAPRRSTVLLYYVAVKNPESDPFRVDVYSRISIYVYFRL
jgi:hypothetical protein